jgi:hypothetical protein
MTVNGGFGGSDNPDSICIDNEPYLCFSVGISDMDYITTLSQLKNEYKVLVWKNKHGRIISRGYLISKSKTIESFKTYFNSISHGEEIVESEPTCFNMYDHDLIVSYGDTEENQNKAREWVKKNLND